MKILFVTPYLPYPLNNGGLIRVHQLAVNIADRHDVTMLCMEPDNDAQSAGIPVLQDRGITVETVPVAANQLISNKRKYQLRSLFSSKPYQYYQYHSQMMQDAIDRHLNSGVYELVIVEFSQMGYYDFKTDLPTYVDQHNVEYEIMLRTFQSERNPLRKLLAWSEWRKYRNHEIENCRKFTACLTTSERDAQILQERAPEMKCHVVPNGVDSEFFSKSDTQIDPNMILFTGTISYYPNTEGVLYFAQNIWPLIKKAKPEATFCIAGKAPPDEVRKLAQQDSSIEVTGSVDDMRDYYAKASVFVVPLRIGGGTRLKILEAMAMEKAVISTSLGAEGIDVTDDQNILLRDTPQDFADAVVATMENEAKRAQLERAGRDLVEAQYDWRAVSANLCSEFEKPADVEDDAQLLKKAC
jgi:sugar transferase (PEP-CTERM/EpsH1 system associated)